MKTYYKITMYVNINNPGCDKDNMTEDIARRAVNHAQYVFDNELIVDPLMGEVNTEYELEKLS